MKQAIRFAPPHSIVFLEDSKGGTIPEIDDRPVRIWSTRSSIVVGCVCEQDGDTELVLSTSALDAPSTPLAFDGTLDTPSGVVAISTSGGDVLLRREVATHFTRVRIWTDHPSEPQHIQVVLG